LKPTPKPGNWVNSRKKRCAIIASGSYRLFVADPASVKFKAIKRLADGSQLCSARVTRDYRVLGVLANDIVIWFGLVTQQLRAAHQRAAIET
jgi:hypothetical protein